MAGMLVGTLFAFLFTIFDNTVANKAGPDWLWAGGRDDLVRNLYFRPNGSFRRFGRFALLATLSAGCGALAWMIQRF